MNNRTIKKRGKQLFGELWQHEYEPWVKHWGVAFKHSRKYYEQERRRAFGSYNLIELPVIKEVDRRKLLGVLRGPIIYISKKDTIDDVRVLDQLWKATHDD